MRKQFLRIEKSLLKLQLDLQTSLPHSTQFDLGFDLFIKSNDGKVESVDAKLNLDDKDYKKTTKVTWLAESPDCKWTPAVAVEFDNIISKPILEKDDDFKQFINKDSDLPSRLARNWSEFFGTSSNTSELGYS